METKHFVDWFEDSVSMDIKTMSNQHFNDVPRDAPVRNATVNSAIWI